MNRVAYLLLFVFYCGCQSTSNDADALQESLAVPDENTLEGQAHRLLAPTYPQPFYANFRFGAIHIGVRENMYAKYKAMEAQELCTIEEKTVSRYPLCVVHLTPKALQYICKKAVKILHNHPCKVWNTKPASSSLM